MKQRKNKIVFVLVLACVVLFITVYSILTFGNVKNEEGLSPERIPMPDLGEHSVEYDSKLEAIEAIKEEREGTAPQLYPDHMVDDKGYFNPDYMEYEKQRIIDSVYRNSNMERAKVPRKEMETEPDDLSGQVQTGKCVGIDVSLSMQERTLSHALFFASHPSSTLLGRDEASTQGVLAYVDGDQTVREGHRLALRLAEDVYSDDNTVPSGTRVYGFVKIRPNRVLVDIVGFGDKETAYSVYDLQDGREGIYLVNHLEGEVLNQGIDQAIGEVNVPGIPQLGGVKRIFQRDNRSIKVKVPNQYQITLKP